MTPHLTPDGYAQTKTKLENLERRLADLESRTDLNPLHREEIRRSYESMIRQYRRETRLYEAVAQAPSSVGKSP
jgi:sugar-specific transcriptional regulator TrmB